MWRLQMQKERIELAFRIVDEVDHIFDEKGNTFLAMRKGVWGDKPDESAKLELRKWNVNAQGEETPNKGFSFLTEHGPDNLAELLVSQGYGNSEEILRSIAAREGYSHIECSVKDKDLKIGYF